MIKKCGRASYSGGCYDPINDIIRSQKELNKTYENKINELEKKMDEQNNKLKRKKD